jgi:hypothetical protein
MTLSPAALKLILDYEVGGGEAYYNRCLQHPEWPGGVSGVTVGVGYDLGYNSSAEIIRDWDSHPDRQRLSRCAKITGDNARRLLSEVRDIITLWNMALDVFQRVTVPRFSDLAARTYPGLDQLHPDAAGAIVSLVYNRGASLTGDRRREMAAIKPLVAAKDYQGIASRIRAMQRLWPNVKGLQQRREAEAVLVERCA